MAGFTLCAALNGEHIGLMMRTARRLVGLLTLVLLGVTVMGAGETCIAPDESSSGGSGLSSEEAKQIVTKEQEEALTPAQRLSLQKQRRDWLECTRKAFEDDAREYAAREERVDVHQVIGNLSLRHNGEAYVGSYKFTIASRDGYEHSFSIRAIFTEADFTECSIFAEWRYSFGDITTRTSGG